MNLRKLILPTILTGTALISSCIKDEAPNAEADIVSCIVPEEILKQDPVVKNNSIELMVKPSVDLSRQAPEFTLTDGATIVPPSGTELDFTHPQEYVVTSESGKWKKTYTVTYKTDEIATRYSFEESLVTAESNNDYVVFVDKDTKGGQIEWASGNPGFRLTGVAKTPDDYPTTQDSNGYVGKCAKLVTRDTGSFGRMAGMPMAAGNLFTGSFNVLTALTDAMASTKMGYPFFHKPTMLTGYYKYSAGKVFMTNGEPAPNKHDMFNIYAMFYETSNEMRTMDGSFKTNGYKSPNLVALARIENPQETNEWTKFELPFIYEQGKVIDTEKLKNGGYKVAIVFSSSVNGDTFDGAPDSTLWIDEVELSYED